MKLLQLCEPGQTPLPHEEASSKEEKEGLAVGIDLGTTHSLVSFSMNGRPHILEEEKEGSLLPSTVCFDENNIKSIGVVGKEEDITIRSSKRLMGKSLQDVQDSYLSKIFPLDLDKATGMVGLKINNQRITPVEIASYILDALKKRAEKTLDTPVTKAVITVPAYFDDAARQATQKAAELCHIKVLRLINEPTAAALAYGLDQGLEGFYCVYDFGGGTFDISLLKLERGLFRVIATGGNAELGGDDIDASIVEHWIEKEAIQVEKKEYQRLLVLAKEAKEFLSQNQKFKGHIDINNIHIQLILEQLELQEIVNPILQKTFLACNDALNSAKASVESLKGIILVGGSTKMPYIKKRVGEYFNKEPLCRINPEKVVAYGAALQAEALTQGSQNLLLDVLPLSLGLETMGGLVEKIIERNAPIPVTKKQEFTTYQDGQSGMRLHVLQGEREKVEDCRSLASFSLKGIPNKPAGHARIEVSFQVDADGLLTVKAKEKTTGICQEVQVKSTYGLEDQDLNRLIQEGFEHAKEDMDYRLFVQEKVEARRILKALDKAVEKDDHLLSVAEKRSIYKQKALCEREISRADHEALKIAMKELEKITQPFAKKRMQSSVEKFLKGQSAEKLES